MLQQLEEVADAIEACYALNRQANSTEEGLIAITDSIIKSFDLDATSFIRNCDSAVVLKMTQVIEKTLRVFHQHMIRKHRKRKYNEN